ncbi:MAG: DUF1573 domain-containing protein, partial [Planctomycetota bacterium]|nr:DUF1573 domain-containing protein [Planctomycetota bacterium]
DIPKKPSTPPQQLFEGPPVPKPSAASLRGARPGAIPKPTVQLKPGQIPAIRFDTPVYDFGRVLSGSKVNHDYWFTNDGSGPVEILAVKPSCGCTASGDFDRIVEPGESGRIPIEVDTAKLKGSVTKSVTIHTNIAAPNKTVLLQIKGDVWNLIEVRPTAANFGKLTGTAQRKLVITNNSEQVAELSDIQSNSPMFKAEIRVIEPGKKFELIVTAQATGSGQASGKITMSTGIADHPTLEVFANAHVPPAVEVGPRLIKLRPAAPGTQQKQRVYVRNNQPEKPLEITDLKVSNPDIKLSLDEQVPGTKFQIILEFPDGYRAPPGGDRLTFSTNAASMPTVQVPILQTGGRIARRPAPRQNNPPAAAVNKPDQTGTNR